MSKIVHFDSKYLSYFFRAIQKERFETEKKKASLAVLPPAMSASVANPPLENPTMQTPTSSIATPRPSMATPSPVNPQKITSSSQHSSRTHTPKSLNFETPTTSERTLGCAVSPASSFGSSVQDFGDNSVKHKKGRPCKLPTAPTYDDFPVNGTAEEKK